MACEALDDGQQARMGGPVAGGDHARPRRAGSDRAAMQIRYGAAGCQADGHARREVDIAGKLAVGEVGGSSAGGNPRQSQRGRGHARLEGRSELGVAEQRQRLESLEPRPLIEVDVDQSRVAAWRQPRLTGSREHMRAAVAGGKDLAGERVRHGGHGPARPNQRHVDGHGAHAGSEVRRSAQWIDQPGSALGGAGRWPLSSAKT